MSGFSIFLNSKVVNGDGHFRCADIPKNLGDRLLTPIRYLFNGNEVTVTHGNRVPFEVSHKAIYERGNSRNLDDIKSLFVKVLAIILFAILYFPALLFKELAYGEPTFHETVLAIAFLVPGLILGSVFKGISFLSKSIREEHSLAVKHFTPIERLNVGKHNALLNIAGIANELANQNPLNQPVNALVIFAQPGTVINTDPGIVRHKPKKLILVNAEITHHRGGLDDQLAHDPDWDSHSYGIVANGSRVIQTRVASLGAALLEKPSKNHVYLV